MAGLLSLSQAALYSTTEATNAGRSQVALYPLLDQNTGRSELGAFKDALKLQYFPETLTDTKEVNYQPKEIPGGSLPIYQWVSSGARHLSFSAWFSCDNDLMRDNTGQALVDRLKDVGEERRNVDIRSAMYWLRSYTLPTYAAGGTADAPSIITVPPQKVLLIIPKSGIGLAGGYIAGALQIDSVMCLMTQCEFTVHAWFPSGLPRLASVQLSFAQIGQFRGNVKFPQSNAGADANFALTTVTSTSSTTGTPVAIGGGTALLSNTGPSNTAFFGYRIK